MNPLIQLKATTLPFLATIVLACLGLSPTARGVVPPPDGGYPGGNTAEGHAALFNLTTGFRNTGLGSGALFSNTTGFENTAVGFAALGDNAGGGRNTAVGSRALVSNSGGNDNNIYIGNIGVDGESDTIRIGVQSHDGLPGAHTATYLAGISGTTVVGDAVFVNSFGQLGVAASSARLKDEIKPMDKASEAILALKPVTFRYKK